MNNLKNSSSLSSRLYSSPRRDEAPHSTNLSPIFQETQIPMLNAGAYSSSTTGNLVIRNPGESLGSRPRGRPLGSKNRPKGIVTNGSEFETMKVISLKVPPGVNILDWVEDFAQSKKFSVAILSGFGSISQATLFHLGTQVPPTIYYEDLQLISLSGSYILYPSVGSSTTTFFNASFARKIGGIAAGSALQLLTSGTVVLTAIIFREMKAFKIEAIA